MSPATRSGTLAANDRRSGLARVSRWRAAIHVSVALWVAMAAGNVALFTVGQQAIGRSWKRSRPARSRR